MTMKARRRVLVALLWIIAFGLYWGGSETIRRLIGGGAGATVLRLVWLAIVLTVTQVATSMVSRRDSR